VERGRQECKRFGVSLEEDVPKGREQLGIFSAVGKRFWLVEREVREKRKLGKDPSET